MTEFHFLRPWWLLSVVPALVIWRLRWRRQDSLAALRELVDAHLLEALLVGGRRRSLVRPVHMALAIWVLGAIAVAGPTWFREPSPFADDQAGLMVLVKAGTTMDATDLQPSRLERAKYKLHDLLAERDGAATGLIVYSGSAHLVMPLTRDDRMLTQLSDALSSDIMPLEGDALSAAVVLADSVLQRAGASGSVLVLADAVAPNEASALKDISPGLPVQFLAMQSPSSPLDAGLRQAAAARGTRVISLSLDNDDINRIAHQATADFQTAPSQESTQQWAELGYWLGPVLLALAILWSRRGWVIS